MYTEGVGWQPCAAKLLSKRVPRTGRVPMHSVTVDGIISIYNCVYVHVFMKE